MTIHNISPSKFAFHRCDRCYWFESQKEYSEPGKTFPQVFNKLDARQGDLLTAAKTTDVNDKMPSGIFMFSQERVTSTPITFGNVKARINGKLDVRVRLDDGTYMVIDNKTTIPSEDGIEKYRTQLLAYAYALENPDKKTARRVTRLGLLCFEPSTMFMNDGKVFQEWKHIWYDFGVPDYSLLFEAMGKFASILGRKEPPEEKCDRCKWHYKIANFKPIDEDMDLTGQLEASLRLVKK